MTDEQIIEVLATKGLGWTARGDWFLTPKRTDGEWEGQSSFKRHAWNPLSDRNAVADVEAKLTPEQRGRYVATLEDLLGVERPQSLWAIRNAPPRLCCEALLEILQ